MSEKALENLPAHDQVSIRAVLVREGEDLAAALANAGLVDAVALPVVLGEQVNLPNGILGDGMTPNLSALLETEQVDRLFASHPAQMDLARSPSEDAQSNESVAAKPATSGRQSFAPISKIPG